MTYEEAEKLLIGFVKAREVSKKLAKVKQFKKYGSK